MYVRGIVSRLISEIKAVKRGILWTKGHCNVAGSISTAVDANIYNHVECIF